VLLSSKSNNIPKVEVLIAIKDQARALHYWKANVLVKSKPKRRPSVRQSPLLRLQLKRPFFASLLRQFNRNKHQHPPTFVALVIIKQNRQTSKG